MNFTAPETLEGKTYRYSDILSSREDNIFCNNIRTFLLQGTLESCNIKIKVSEVRKLEIFDKLRDEFSENLGTLIIDVYF